MLLIFPCIHAIILANAIMANCFPMICHEQPEKTILSHNKAIKINGTAADGRLPSGSPETTLNEQA